MNPKKPKISPKQLDMYSEPVTHVYQALEEEIFEQIAKRLKTSQDLTKDNVFDWQVDKMNQLRLVNKETVKALSKATGKAEKEIRKAIESTGIDTIKSVDYELSEIYDKPPVPSEIDKILESYVKQTFREFDNFVNQTLIDTNYGKGTVSKMYQKMVEEATGKVLAGTTTTNKAITDTVVKWARNGIDTAFVDRGGNVWRLENYARTVIRSTVNRTYREQRISRMDDYDVNTVLISSLPDPREICSQIQGKVATTLTVEENDTGYPSIYEYGYTTPGGLFGINCRHSMFAFVPGLNENNQKQYSESEMNENRELRNKQRYYERQVRDAKRSQKLAEITGDEESIQRYKNLVRNRQKAMREFIDGSGRTRDYSREQIHS